MSDVKWVIGIDPGKSGGIAVYSVKTKKVYAFNMPQTPEDMVELFNKYNNNAYCYMEKIHGMPGMGGVSMFTFGKQYGWLEMCLVLTEIPVEAVTPQKWMKELQLGTKKGKSGTEWKNKLKFRAQQLFPGQKITLKKSDALLILQYGLKQLKIR